MRAVQINVTGAVQQVGFRWATQREARRLRLDGWVRNEPDGSVTVWAQGDPAAVDYLLAFLRVGPRSATVIGLEIIDEEPDVDMDGFAARTR